MEVRRLKDLWWHEECLYNVEIYKRNHARRRGKEEECN
jgi:hypothetical protein